MAVLLQGPPIIKRAASFPFKRSTQSQRLSAVGVPQSDITGSDKKPVPHAKALLQAAKRRSTDSSTSGIVWSAVVEKFSEMAQEIAGKVSPKPGERRSNLSISDRRASIQTTTYTVRPAKALDKITSPIREEEPDAADYGASGADSIATDLPQSVSTQSELATMSLPYTSPLPKIISSDSSASPESSAVHNAPLSPIKLKRRSTTTAALQSILKRGEHSRSASDADAASPDTGTGSSLSARPWARKAGRSVRVQSHHATNVEGDYAAFLKRASRAGGFGNTFDKMRDEFQGEGSDKQSVLSGRSGRSVNSRYSGKSGIENGCFRRGSMSSIKTGRTICTVGGVSVKDMSR